MNKYKQPIEIKWVSFKLFLSFGNAKKKNITITRKSKTV